MIACSGGILDICTFKAIKCRRLLSGLLVNLNEGKFKWKICFVDFGLGWIEFLEDE